MSKFIQFWKDSKQNKIFVVVVVLILLMAIDLTTHIFSDLPFFKTQGYDGQIVATVVTVQSDVRQRPVEESSWYRAEPQTDVIRGDAVYSGKESRSQVQMKSGGWIELGEETLVIFDDIDGVTIPDVARGQVKLKVTGQMKIAISGEVTEFSGAQSELVLNLEGLKRQIQVLSGAASVTQGGKSKSLQTGQTFELPPSATIVKGPPKIKVPGADELVSEARIRDVRKPKESTPVELRPVEFTEAPPIEAPPTPADPVVEEKASIEIKPEPAAPEEASIEIKPEPAVGNVVVTEAPKPLVQAKDPVLAIDRVMKVQEVYSRRGKTALVPRTGLKSLKVPIALQWQGTETNEDVRLQIAKTKDFKKPAVERIATGSTAVVNEWRPGKNYWRVSRDGQTWSEPAEVFVRPTVASSLRPTVTPLRRQVAVHPKGRGPEAQAKLRFEELGPTKARGWVLQGSSRSDFAPEKTKTVYVKEPRVDIPIARPGKYYFRVRSVASGGEISRFSESVEVKASPAAAPAAPIRNSLAENEKRRREIANVEAEQELQKQRELEEEMSRARERASAQSRSKLSTKQPPREDDTRPRPWALILEGGAMAIVSTEQIDLGANPAATNVIGLIGAYSDDRHSALLGYKSKFSSSNQEGAGQSNARFMTRYTRWWQTGWSPLKLGWLGEFSSYRNSSTTDYSTGYDFAKTGVDVGIRMSDRWKTGGDVSLGSWFDKNRLFEIGGFISYDLSRELAFGVGYRLSLFEAGSQESAPIELPYREAMGEAYSSLRFSF